MVSPNLFLKQLSKGISENYDIMGFCHPLKNCLSLERRKLALADSMENWIEHVSVLDCISAETHLGFI